MITIKIIYPSSTTLANFVGSVLSHSLNKRLSYPPRLIKYIAANIPIVANKNSKLGVRISEGYPCE